MPNNITNLLQSISLIDSAIQQNSTYPETRINLQEEKIRLIESSLIELESGCKILPEELEGKYKTVGLLGKRTPLARAIYILNNGEADIPANLFRSCRNPDCYNAEHLISASEARQMQQIVYVQNNKRKPYQSIQTSQSTKPVEKKRELTEEELEEESNRVMNELFAEQEKNQEKNQEKHNAGYLTPVMLAEAEAEESEE